MSSAHAFSRYSASSTSLGFARSAAWCLPAAGKHSKTGEDGFYIARNGRSIGVADGVGGWVQKGIDPSLFTRSFMRFALERAEALGTGLKDTSTERTHRRDTGHPYASHTLMHEAFGAVLEQNLPGSCTALFATLEQDAPSGGRLVKYPMPKRSSPSPGPYATLNIANVGDCALAVIRKNAGIVFLTQEQMKGDNFPFQLGAEAESPSDGTIVDFVVANNDVIVMGSDGLFVNVDRLEMLEIVGRQWNNANGTPATNAAIDCAAVAQQLGKLARSNYLKPDDITVIVTQLGQVEADPHYGTAEHMPETKRLQLPDYSQIEEYFAQNPVVS